MRLASILVIATLLSIPTYAQEPTRLQSMPPTLAEKGSIIVTSILSKEVSKQEYQEFVFFDLQHIATGLDRPARAIKGSLKITDLFGEPVLSISWTLTDPLSPGEILFENGVGFKYNQFIDEHRWVRTNAVKDMDATFVVESIIYADGSRKDL
ncbi:MAG: hypothetical protein WD423_03700 [Rhodothermales bacterium]